MKHVLGLIGAFVFTVCNPSTSSAQFRLSRLFGDGMVVQRGIDVPVWGRATPGDEVSVTFDGRTYVAIADGEGRWVVKIAPLSVGGPYEMTIVAPNVQREIRDILVGDVWICSGQSNMEWIVADSRDAEAEIEAADDEHIRQFKVPRSWAPMPETELAGGSWEVADPQHVAEFTAVGYFFARELRKHVDVPIGLVNTSWGGSRIEPWMSAAALGLEHDAGSALVEELQMEDQRILGGLESRIGSLPDEDRGLVDGRAVWADPELDDADWATMPVPSVWEHSGYERMDGIGWYRVAFDLTAEEATADVSLGLGKIDDSDISWVNGHEIGRSEMVWSEARHYEVPSDVLRPGRNVIAVRAEDTGGDGGVYGDPDLLYVEVNGTRRPLAGDWKFKAGLVRVNLGRQNQVATLLYNKMIYPLLSYPVKGFLWYQGESNAGIAEAWEYRDLFANLIASWREDWGLGDLPFLWVQLANFMAPDDLPPAESGWAVLRESQSSTLRVPNTAQAVIIDIGEADDIHPRNKQDVGVRLALAARRIAYDEDVVHSGPLYRGYEVAGERVSLEFDHVGSGLVARDADLVHGFAVAGPDSHFVWADAKIDGERVVVWSDRVADPVAVRYAWGNNPVRANLYNREGLPASPFRTDDW